MSLRDGAIEAMAERMHEYCGCGNHLNHASATQANRALDALLDYLTEHKQEWWNHGYNLQYEAGNIHTHRDGLLAALRENTDE